MQAKNALNASILKPFYRGNLLPMSLTDGLIGAVITAPLSAFAAMAVGKMTVRQSELTNLRQTMLTFEERLRIRDAEYIKMQAEITSLTLARDMERSQHTLCEQKIGILQGEYDSLKLEFDTLKRAIS